METYKIYLSFFCFGFFVVSVIITLLNKSTAILMNHDIFVETSYPPTSLLKHHIKNTSDIAFRKSLKKALVLRRLHLLFAAFSLICGVVLWSSFAFN